MTNIRFQFRSDTAANWTSEDPTLAMAEVGYETDTDKIKIGDGTTAWSSLSYYEGTKGDTGDAGADGNTVLSGAVDPTTEGEDGDFYINTNTSTIFGPKSGTWPTGVSLVGATGATGPAGADGNDGAPGADGADGEGVPVGGTTGQVLAKIDGTDYNTEWVDAASGSYSDSDVDTHLNVSGATTDQVLSWDGSDYVWADQSGGGSFSGDTLQLTFDFVAEDNITFPTMTGETTGAWTLTESDRLSSPTYSFWRSFDSGPTDGNFFHSNSANAIADGTWVQFQNNEGQAFVINSFTSECRSGFAARVLTGAKIQGSTDGSSFTDIETVNTGTTPAAGDPVTITFDTSLQESGEYTYLRLVVTELNGSTSTVGYVEMESASVDISLLASSGTLAEIEATGDSDDSVLTFKQYESGVLTSYALSDIAVPAGGTTGQVLSKVDGTDYNVEWADAGGGYDPTTDNDPAIGVSASSGTDSVAFGEDAASADRSVAIGEGASASQADSVAIGRNASAASSTQSTAVGRGAIAGGTETVALGYLANAAAGGTAIGHNADCGTLGVAVGASATCDDGTGVAVGHEAEADGTGSIAIGYRAGVTAAQDYAIVFGRSASATGTRQVLFDSNIGTMINGGIAAGGVLFNTNTISVKADTSTGLQVSDGTDTFRADPFNGVYIFPNLPTADPVVAGQLWNDSGTLKVSAG